MRRKPSRSKRGGRVTGAIRPSGAEPIQLAASRVDECVAVRMTLRAGVLAEKRYAWMLPHHTGGVRAGTWHR
ncbi:hypothetical protein BCEP4_220119 [Burkholderia cepacia]|nr:hypothetical protein BCEP4_220119 [Burkholderia cepacia]